MVTELLKTEAQLTDARIQVQELSSAHAACEERLKEQVSLTGERRINYGWIPVTSFQLTPPIDARTLSEAALENRIACLTVNLDAANILSTHQTGAMDGLETRIKELETTFLQIPNHLTSTQQDLVASDSRNPDQARFELILADLETQRIKDERLADETARAVRTLYEDTIITLQQEINTITESSRLGDQARALLLERDQEIAGLRAMSRQAFLAITPALASPVVTPVKLRG